MNVLVVDIGGTGIKLFNSASGESERFRSHPELTPRLLMQEVRARTVGWNYQAVSIGYPGKVAATSPAEEPGNLGNGWVGYDFEAAFGRPTLIVNDAVLQALGGYDGGKMLFLGFGTGLGSALVTRSLVVPLELGELPFGGTEKLWERLGRSGLERDGEEVWRAVAADSIERLRVALNADYVLVGGGNAALIDPLPACARRGGNEDAFLGGRRLWEDGVKAHDGSARMWSVL